MVFSTKRKKTDMNIQECSCDVIEVKKNQYTVNNWFHNGNYQYYKD